MKPVAIRKPQSAPRTTKGVQKLFKSLVGYLLSWSRASALRKSYTVFKKMTIVAMMSTAWIVKLHQYGQKAVDHSQSRDASCMMIMFAPTMSLKVRTVFTVN